MRPWYLRSDIIWAKPNGAETILLRAAVAALLNSTRIAYPFREGGYHQRG